MSPRVTISFETDHPLAMALDWPRELGLLDPRKLRTLGVLTGLEVDIESHADLRTGVEPLPEVMVEAMEEAYLNTEDRFDARNEFRVALRAALAAAPPGFFDRWQRPRERP